MRRDRLMKSSLNGVAATSIKSLVEVKDVESRLGSLTDKCDILCWVIGPFIRKVAKTFLIFGYISDPLPRRLALQFD